MTMLSLLTGCPWVGAGRYEEVQDGDGDGEPSVRFGGADCLDDDPTVSDCDVDGDGFIDAALPEGDDCDDTNDSIFPGAPEICDGNDNDCNGATDNDDPAVFSETVAYIDADNDGEGDPRRSRACAEAGDVDNALDCNDDDPAVHSGAEERCDAIDNDCDGVIDDGGIWNADVDGDGYGDPGVQSSGPCQLGPDDALAANADDCDDSDAAIHPAAFEVAYDGVDTNCNGLQDEWDADLDAHVPHQHWAAANAANQAQPEADRWPLFDGDCDDLDPLRYVGNPEVCDGVDNDCDDAIDAADPDPGPLLQAQLTQVFADADGDHAAGTPLVLCPNAIDPAVHSFSSTDCDDTEPLAAPGLEERCDSIDNDCDGRVDWSSVAFDGSSTWYRDGDGDQFGDLEVQACGADTFQGLVDIDGDCNDGDPASYPNAEEICGDAVRQDCSDASVWDCDRDGQEGLYFGNGSGEDCDDEQADVYLTTAPLFEVCDGIDNDCDGLIDSADLDNLDLTQQVTWFTDADLDGFGDALLPGLDQCDSPGTGFSPNPTDCDDGDPTVNPDTQWYEDLDGDSYGNAAVLGVIDCVRPAGSWATRPGDCNDLDPDRSPTSIWRPDADGDGVGDPTGDLTTCVPPAGYVPSAAGIDCNDDDDQVTGGTAWYLDEDGDGHGNQAFVVVACTRPSGGFVESDADCDDRDPTRNPDRPEICNGVDDDCDGLSDDDDDDALGLGPIGFRDQDGDGFGTTASERRFCASIPSGWSSVDGDCNDLEPSISPSAAEVCGNGIDEDCTGDEEPPIWFVDADADGFGTGPASAPSCDPPDMLQHWASIDTDCDDTQASVFPGAVEPDACDAIDHDCDGLAELRLTWFPDRDLDGFGDDLDALDTCSPPVDPHTSWILRGGDCDDTDPSIDFGRVWFDDLDGDGRGNSAASIIACPIVIEHVAQSIWLVHDNNDNGAFDAGDLQRSVFSGDCDDDDPSVGSPRAYHTDADGDGFGSIQVPLTTICPAPGGGPPTGFVTSGGDCVDVPEDAPPGGVPAQIFPTADEHMSDNIDNDCDGLIDLPGDGVLWYLDLDHDGLGGAVSPEGFVQGAVTNSADCDDGDDTIGSTHLAWPDTDGDGFGAGQVLVIASCHDLDPGLAANATDCDDTDPQSFPMATERCNGLDDDCDGQVPLDEGARYADEDGDGYGAGAAFPNCLTPHGVATDGDCDDTRVEVHPDAHELCNGRDDNCDGTPDEGMQNEVYADVDGDGHGSTPLLVCGPTPPGYVDHATDCDDTLASVSPDRPERCFNGLDDDCNHLTDDVGLGFVDLDGDLFGGEMIQDVCAHLLQTGGDCDDASTAVNPGVQTDLCDDLDNDCDGTVDNGATFTTTFFDGDGDGVGTNGQGARYSCVFDPNWVLHSNDCDDTDPLVYPGAPERCNGRDDDCSGNTDNEVDDDHDGFLSCNDCDDANALANPGMLLEFCDGADNDCDGANIDGFVDVSNPDTGRFVVGDTRLYREFIDPVGFSIESRIEVCTSGPPSGTWNAPGSDHDRVVLEITHLDLGSIDRCNDGNPTTLWMADIDGDSVPSWDGDGRNIIQTCGTAPAPAGFVPWSSSSPQDCDPFNPTRFTQVQTGDFEDADADGFYSLLPAEFPHCGGAVASMGVDCNDQDPTNHTDASFLSVSNSHLPAALLACTTGEIILDLAQPYDWQGAEIASESTLTIQGQSSLCAGGIGCVTGELLVKGNPSFQELGFDGLISVDPGSSATFRYADIRGGLEVADGASALLDASQIWIDDDHSTVNVAGELQSRNSFWTGLGSPDHALAVAPTGSAELEYDQFSGLLAGIDVAGIFDGDGVFFTATDQAFLQDAGFSRCRFCTFDMTMGSNTVEVLGGHLDMVGPRFDFQVADPLPLVFVDTGGSVNLANLGVDNPVRTLLEVAGVATVDLLYVGNFTSEAPIVNVNGGNVSLSNTSLDVQALVGTEPVVYMTTGQLDVDGLSAWAPPDQGRGIAQLLRIESGGPGAQATLRDLFTMGMNTVHPNEELARPAVYVGDNSTVHISEWQHDSADGFRGRALSTRGQALVTIEDSVLDAHEGIFSTAGATAVLRDTEMYDLGGANDALFRTRNAPPGDAVAGNIVLERVRAFQSLGGGSLVDVDGGSFTATRSLLYSDVASALVADNGTISLVSTTVHTTGSLQVYGSFGAFHIDRALLTVSPSEFYHPFSTCIVGGGDGSALETVSIFDSWVPIASETVPGPHVCLAQFSGSGNTDHPNVWSFDPHFIPDNPVIRDTYGEVHR